MAMIELGDVGDDAPAATIAAPDLRRTVRRLLIVMGLAGLVALGGAAPPPPPAVQRLWSTAVRPGDEAGYTDGTAFVSRTAGSTRSEVSAYDLVDGRRRWTAAVSVAGPVRPEPAGDVVLLRADPNSGSLGVYYRRTTVALDAATGAERWRTTGEPGTAYGGTVLIERRDPDGLSLRLDQVRLRDGGLVWSRPLPRDGRWTVAETAGAPASVVSVDGRGDVSTWRWSDGALLHAGRLQGDIGWLAANGELLIASFTVTGDGYARDTTRLFRTGDLHQLWNVGPGRGVADLCGPVVCTIGETGVAGRDPRTGVTRWQRAGIFVGYGFGRVFLLNPADRGIRLVDPATGDPVGPPIAGQVVWPADPQAARLYALRAEPTGEIRVGEVDLASGRPDPRGTIDGIDPQTCIGRRPYLACRGASAITVIRVR